MNANILEQLEFDKVKILFSRYLQTEQGQEELRDLKPMTEVKRVSKAFDEVIDMEQIFVKHQSFETGSLSSISEILRRLELDATIGISDMIAIKQHLQVVADVSRFYREMETIDFKTLHNLFEKLTVLPNLQSLLEVINDNGFIESFASSELNRIRRHINDNENKIRQILQNILKKQSHFLTDTLVANRNGRSVLPVKNSYRNRISGTVHDISASGNTVYIEPHAVITFNEKITQLRADERHEITRILRELSNKMRLYTQTIQNNAWVLGHLDFVRAKYLFMQEHQAVVPLLSMDKTVQLLQVRHPLLANPVPNDLHFADDLTVIVITGPNTGGKTVMLKTLGIAQIMGQSGLPILADKGSKIAVFYDIFADIGDDQSIEQSLSTFSSHMTTIIDILKRADKNSLVLVDELGSGTDPKEGAALGVAILEDFRLRDIKTLATTHYPELKAYSIETENVENASMAFDTEKLIPTYHFMQGVPGRSNAFEIARRLGLSETIVNEAERSTDSETDVNVIIERLEEQTHESRKRLEHIKEVEQENVKFNRAVKKLYHEFSQEKDREIKKATAKAQEIVDKAILESNHILKTLHERSLLKPHEVIDAKNQLQQLLPEVDLSKNKILKKAKKRYTPHVGDTVVVTAYGQLGTLINQVKNGKWEVQVGLIKMLLSEEEFTLKKTQENNQKPQKKQVSVIKKTKCTSTPHARLDLRGKRYEEAMQELDVFIDQALLNNIGQVDIIHGIGTGVIRDGVTKYLRSHKHVKSYHYAPQNAGGSGCTIVQLG